jgi:hypothetical protein
VILGLDLGTTTGFACLGDLGIVSGVWRFPEAHPSRAYALLRSRLVATFDLAPADARRPHLVAYERVPGQAHVSSDAAHRWGGFEAILLAECERAKIPFLGVGIATWKKEAGLRSGTDAGVALVAAQQEWPKVTFATPDEAVARWIARAARRVSGS